MKKELLDNNMTIKIKDVIHNNKRNISNENKNLVNLNQIQSSNSSKINVLSGIKSNNKYNLLLTKTLVNNDNIYNKTLFNKTTNGFNKGKSIDSKKFNYNFNVLFKIKNNFEYSPFKPIINHYKKQQSALSKKNPVNMKNIEGDDIHNNIKKNRKLNFNLRSLDKEINHRKISINKSHKNHKSAKKPHISLPKKIFPENKCEKRNIDRTKVVKKKENIISFGQIK
jgi:hypothetical protein